MRSAEFMKEIIRPTTIRHFGQIVVDSEFWDLDGSFETTGWTYMCLLILITYSFSLA